MHMGASDMSDDATKTDQEKSDPPAGMAATIRNADARGPFSVALTRTDQLNTLAPRLRPAACWRLNDHRFDFDSSFVRPTATREFGLLANARPAETGAGPATGLLLSVFGHADPTNSDEYNKILSGRRAASIYALLVRDADTWEKIYANPYRGDVWTTKHLQLMLRQTGYTDATESGSFDAGTTKATKAFQKAHGKTPSGSLDQPTRKDLYLAYMDAICQQNGTPFGYRPQDFVSRGTSADWKGDCQGCSEFNPVMVFSKIEAKLYAKSGMEGARNSENASNRRVVIYMFHPEQVPTSAFWPCPTIKEHDQGIPICHKQFWPDGEARRANQDSRREHLNGGRTMACSFYDSLVRGSPCEGVTKTLNITLLNRDGKWAKNEPYRVESNADVRTGFTNEFGRLQELEFNAGSMVTIEWGYPSDQAEKQGQPEFYDNFTEGYLNTSDADADSGRVERELYNLGYRDPSQSNNRDRYRTEYLANESTDDAIHETHATGSEKASRDPDLTPIT